MIGVVIPGLSPMTVGPLYSNLFTMNLMDPKKVSAITIYQLEKFKDDVCAALYYIKPPYEKQIYLGCIKNERPSEIIYTGWEIASEWNSLNQISIIIRMEKIENIKSEMGFNLRTNMEIVHLSEMKRSLTDYLKSINQGFKSNLPNEYILVPAKALDDWNKEFLLGMGIQYDGFNS